MLKRFTLADFSAMVKQLNAEEYGSRRVSPDEYAEFERHWVLYALQEKRYGQAFCDHFGIFNSTPLYNFKDEKICRRWIDDNYLEKVK